MPVVGVGPSAPVLVVVAPGPATVLARPVFLIRDGRTRVGTGTQATVPAAPAAADTGPPRVPPIVGGEMATRRTVAVAFVGRPTVLAVVVGRPVGGLVARGGVVDLRDVPILAGGRGEVAPTRPAVPLAMGGTPAETIVATVAPVPLEDGPVVVEAGLPRRQLLADADVDAPVRAVPTAVATAATVLARRVPTGTGLGASLRPFVGAVVGAAGETVVTGADVVAVPVVRVGE